MKNKLLFLKVNYTIIIVYLSMISRVDRWKRLVSKSDDIIHLSKRFYSLAKEWREIHRETIPLLEWISKYS